MQVLTKRVAYLVEACGVPAEDILAITFTRKGSAEMKQRLQRELPPAAAAAVTIGTFHAIAFRVLRRRAPQALTHPTHTVVLRTISTHECSARAGTSICYRERH